MGRSFLTWVSKTWVLKLFSFLRPLDDANAVGTRDDGRLGKSDEKSVLDDTRNSSQRQAKRTRIGDPPERGVEDEMTTVRDESKAALRLAERQRAGIAGG